MILSLAGLCFSGSFSAIQYLPDVQAQTQAATSPQPSVEELNIQMAQISASNSPEDIAMLAFIWETPLVYNVTIYSNGNGTENKVFSKTFVTSGEKLPLELVRGENETITFGPDFSSTGAYHVQGPIFTENANYTIRSEISAIGGRHPETPLTDEFSLRTIT